ncbi:LOW QUALITY PROTEIN: hypothetical protein X943_002000 [Babesia divergens]|uniref:Exoribonuclease phosphorolytic domain-containing protein n=1 Tax=Babesia divergens TaxID=32595 RepID=A0AAD9GFR7_BABDI|nr:LOW QUALITY PROTEIN: hypothetical protein X943_002000 [Babesia divergens]
MSSQTPLPVPTPRNLSQIRPLGIDLCISKSASGSSYITLGETKVKCCVNAPRPCNRRILHETGILNIIVRHSVKDQRKRPEYNLTTVLTELFERHILLRRYPHHLIEAWLTIEEDDGGLFPACVMGLFLALADCGVQMLDTISAASVVCAITVDHMLIQFAFKNPDGSLQLALDLNAHEEAYYQQLHPGISRVHLAYCPNLNTVGYLLCTGGSITYEVLQKIGDVLADMQMVTMAQAACDVLTTEINSAMIDHIKWKRREMRLALDGNSICPEIDL